MCLITKQKWPKIAWKPITTYKVVYFLEGYQSFLTMFQSSPIRIGKTYKETLKNIFGSRKKFSTWLVIALDAYEMYFGLHSYTNEDDSRAIARRYDKHDTRIVKCIIPRFSLYWVGVDNDIVSNKLKYVKIL